MPDQIVIKGLAPYDGRYELDLENAPLTTREWGWVKRHAGYLPVNIDRNTSTDPEMITILAVIVMRRAGTIDSADVAATWERFADAPFGAAVTFEGDAEEGEADEDPPASSNGKQSSSGDSSTTDSGTSADSPSRTGSPGSATSVSAPQMSVS